MSKTPPNIGIIFTVICIVVGLLHIYIGARLLADLQLSLFAQITFIALLVTSAIVIPSAMLARFIIKNQQFADVIAWAGFSAMGIFSSLLVLTFVRDLVLIASSFFVPADFFSVIQHDSALLVLSFTALATVVGFINARRLPAIVHINIPLQNLPAELEGFTLVQISDIHIGPTIKGDYLAGIVERVNALQPHVVAITGDLIDGSVAQLREHVAPLKNIHAQYGSYFITGNHEYYSDAQAWIHYVKQLGIHVLLNEHHIIHHHNSPVVIAGVTDFNAGQIEPHHATDPQAALAGTENLRAPKIMLAHQPRSAEAVAAAGADLQLSGHTHGGQFWPWNFFVPLQQPYTAGLHKLNNLWVYVNRGTGYWGPPIRLGRRSEITRIRLINA